MSLLVLNEQDVEAANDYQSSILALANGFNALQENNVALGERQVLTVGGSYDDLQFLSMAAAVKSKPSLAVKLSSIAPKNKERNIPLIHGIVIVVEANTGVPLALLEGRALTAIRTGAMAGLATDLLAIKHASTLAIVGCGSQAKTQIKAICSVRKITRICLTSRNLCSAQKLASWVASHVDSSITVETYKTIGNAVKDADIVCTCTDKSDDTPLIYAHQVPLHCHINAIGGISELALEVCPELVSKTSIFVEHKAAAIKEAGEIISVINSKLVDESNIYTIGELISGKASGRVCNKDQVTLFRSVGIAIQDTVVAQDIYNVALIKGIGSSIKF